jgi:hypothetical protein
VSKCPTNPSNAPASRRRGPVFCPGFPTPRPGRWAAFCWFSWASRPWRERSISAGVSCPYGAAVWLRQHAPTPAVAAPAHPTDPAIPPYAYYDYRYLNRAYEYAAYAHAAFWLLLIIPLLLLAATPLVTVLADFSARGMQSAVLNARGVAAVLVAWSRAWLVLLIMTLTVFVGLKVYGRYTLPKRFRPRIHMIRLTFRLAALSIVLLSAATFFVFAADPVGQLLIDILRKSFGF